MIGSGVRANSSLAGGEADEGGQSGCLSGVRLNGFIIFLVNEPRLIRWNRRHGKRHFRSRAVAVPQRLRLTVLQLG